MKEKFQFVYGDVNIYQVIRQYMKPYFFLNKHQSPSDIYFSV